MKTRLLLSLSVLLAACQPTPPATSGTDPTPKPAARPVTATPWTLPVTAAAQPDLVALPDGTLLMGWIEKGDGRHAMRVTRSTPDGGWGPVRTVAEGDDWFVNWADIPHVQATPDGALWAHWLRKSAAATYAYDVVLSRSGDGGATWSAPIRVNEDGTPTEHGFVSMWPAAHDRLGIAWLDGRDTGGAGHEGHGGGMMSLRGATFDAGLVRHGETRIDASVCDCCQTDVAATARGPLLVYRDRTEAEVRDIATTRLEGDTWTTAKYVHADRWTMPACPVNGPAVTARGETAVVAWYTGAGGTPSVRVARSTDAGDRFGAPLVLDTGSEVLGRVDTVLDRDGRAWVLWLREDAGGQSLWLARLAPTVDAVEQRLKIADLKGRGRGTGIPRLALAGDRLHLLWTDVVDGAPRLQGATVATR